MKPKVLMKRLESIKERLDDRYIDEVVFVDYPPELNGLFLVNGEAMPAGEVSSYLGQDRFRKAVVFVDNIPREDESEQIYWSMDDDNNIIFYESEEEFLNQHRVGKVNR